jgi:alpha-galactosidase
VPDDDLVRADMFRRFGVYPTESSEHHAEYNPWYIGKRDERGDAVERFHIPIGEYLDRVAHNLDEYAETKRMLDAGEPFEIERSGEYAATIIDAMTTGVPARIVANSMNRGALIPNLDANACVEVPAMVDGLGPHPVGMGPLPVHLAAYIRGAVDMQALTVRAALDRDRQAIGHAVMTDPVVQTHLTLEDAWRLTDEMIEAEAEWLPAWLGGRVEDGRVPASPVGGGVR